MTTATRNGRMPPETEAIGAVGLPLFSGHLRLDPNPRIYGTQAIRIYRDMAYDEPAARALLYAYNTLLHSAPVAVPGGATDADKEAAALLQACVEELRTPIGTILRQLRSALWAGWDIHEVVLKPRDDGTVGWLDWELRRQSSHQRWLTDEATVVNGWEQRPEPDYQLRQIPLSRAIHLVADDGEGSPEGLSLLRGMYRPRHFVKNLELFMGIAAERFGSGLPVFEMEPGVVLTPQDEAELDAIGNALRQNERAWLRLPAGVRFRFAPSPGLDVMTYLEIIRYLRITMLGTAMADFISLGTQNGGGGAFALSKDKTELFLLALNAYQDREMEAINRQAVNRLFSLPRNRVNRFGSITKPPRLMLPAVKRYDLQALGSFLQTLQAVMAWTPTPEDEAHLRKISDLLDMTPGQIRDARKEVPAQADEDEADVPPPSNEESTAGDDVAVEMEEDDAAPE